MPRAQLRVGLDMLATVGSITDPRQTDGLNGNDVLQVNQEQSPSLAQYGNPLYQSAVGRNVVGAYGELTLSLARDCRCRASGGGAGASCG